jgi:quinol monooxygenase YgiN
MLKFLALLITPMLLFAGSSQVRQSQFILDGVDNSDITVNFQLVSYFEVAPSNSARETSIAAMKAYHSGVRTQAGFMSFEAFEQLGRPGHFVMIEIWSDTDSFEKRGPLVQQKFTDALQPIRLSDIDRRPYKTLTTAAHGQTNNQTIYVITHVDASPTPQLPAMLMRLAGESRRDPGSLRFDIYQHTMRANHFTIVEAWRDRQAHDAHAAAQHTRQYREEFAPMAGSPVDERLFQAVIP